MKRQCSKRVYSGERWDMSGHQCRVNATMQDGDKWYCKKHHPKTVADKKAKWEADFKAKMAAADAARKQNAEDARRAAAYPRLLEFVRRVAIPHGDRPYSDALALLSELGELE